MQAAESTKLGVDRLDYQLHMHHALRLAETVLTTTPNPRVGCVIVGAMGDNQVVGEGCHEQPGHGHAEVNALTRAGEAARGGTAFVSLEPCAHHGRTPPCAEALIEAGVCRVVIAGLDPDPRVSGKGVELLEGAGIEVVHLTDFEERARTINAGYFKRHTLGLPFVRCKLAMSLDGRTAAANGESKWISGAASRADVQRLRAASCAIITGVETVLEDDPALTVRPEQMQLSAQEQRRNRFALGRQPLRVVLDSTLRTPTTARILQQPGRTLLLTRQQDEVKWPGDTEAITLPGAPGRESRVGLVNVLELLASGFTVNEVLLEAGPTLAGAFVEAGLVDELVVYIGEKLLGSAGRPLLELPGLLTMADQIGLKIRRIDRIGDDCRLIASILPHDV